MKIKFKTMKLQNKKTKMIYLTTNQLLTKRHLSKKIPIKYFNKKINKIMEIRMFPFLNKKTNY